MGKKKSSGKKKGKSDPTSIKALMKQLQALFGAGKSHLNMLKEGKPIITRIQKLQRQQGDDIGMEEEPDFDAFREWVISKTGSEDLLSKIKFGKINELSNGVIAATDISENEELFRVPEKLMMVSCKYYNKKLNDNRLLESMNSIALAMYLLTEKLKGKESFYYHYIQILPKSFPTLPFYWTEKQLLQLQYTSAGRLALERVVSSFSYYSFLYKSLLDNAMKLNDDSDDVLTAKSFTYDLFLWALSVVVTRQNNYGERDVALMPIFDMCNHLSIPNPSLQATVFDPNVEALICYSISDFKKDEEVNIFYGQRTNAELLVYSGFVDPNNYFDRTEMELLIGKGKDDVFNMRLLLFDKHAITYTKVLDKYQFKFPLFSYHTDTDPEALRYAYHQLLNFGIILEMEKDDINGRLKDEHYFRRELEVKGIDRVLGIVKQQVGLKHAPIKEANAAVKQVIDAMHISDIQNARLLIDSLQLIQDDARLRLADEPKVK